MNAPQPPVSPRRRMQELQSIPDSQRTDEQWDELNELEIKLAPGNRDPGARGGGGDDHDGQPRHNQNQNRGPQGGGQGGGGGGQGGAGGGQGGGGSGPGQPSGRGPMGKRPARKFHKRPKPPTTNTP